MNEKREKSHKTVESFTGSDEQNMICVLIKKKKNAEEEERIMRIHSFYRIEMVV